MNRRRFLAALAATPVVGYLCPRAWGEKPVGFLVSDVTTYHGEAVPKDLKIRPDYAVVARVYEEGQLPVDAIVLALGAMAEDGTGNNYKLISTLKRSMDATLASKYSMVIRPNGLEYTNEFMRAIRA